ncbi:MAG: hypothetical protein ACOX6D_02680 [Thermoguttaceae bacterium]|jgi:hypothetical protein
MSTEEAIGILNGLDNEVLEVVLDQVRIAYRVQQAVKASQAPVEDATKEPSNA